MADVAVTLARRIAFDVLRRVETEEAYAGVLLHARLDEKIKPEDAALSTELTLGVLRWQRLLDFLIERHTRRPASAFDLEVLLALRMGVYQLRFLTRVPARAAVNESVELVKRARKRSAAPLVNAALRKASADSLDGAALTQILPQDLPLAERLGILHSHPAWMVERWLRRYDEARTVRLLEWNNQPPPLACAVHNPAQREHVLSSLKQNGLTVEPGHLLRSALLVHGGSPARTEAFRRGLISIQDEASQAIPLLLDVHQGEKVLDLCSAPGGKTIALASAAGQEGLVVAADLHEHRVRAMKTELKRLGAQQVHTLALDATEALPFGMQFDRILVDAPCSGTGTLARHPEIRWRLQPEDLTELARQQAALVARAVEWLAPAGRLIYSTCSLEPEENEDIVSSCRQSHLRDSAGSVALRVAHPIEALRPHLAEEASAEGLFASQGYFRTFPPENRCDGFFAAALERIETQTSQIRDR